MLLNRLEEHCTVLKCHEECLHKHIVKLVCIVKLTKGLRKRKHAKFTQTYSHKCIVGTNILFMQTYCPL